MKRMYLYVVIKLEDYDNPLGIAMDVTVAEDDCYTVSKMVTIQKDSETGEEDWVVLPKDQHEFRLKVLSKALEAEIVKAQTDPNYSQESKIYEQILNSTTKQYCRTVIN